LRFRAKGKTIVNQAEDLPVQAVTGAPARSGSGYVFIGKDGLRAGWSLLLFAALVAVSAVVFTLIAKYLIGSHPPAKGHAPSGGFGPGSTLSGEGLGFFSVALAALIVSVIERRPFASYGLRRGQLVPDALTGALWGLVMLSLLVGALVLSGALKVDGLVLHGGQVLSYGAEWLLAFLFVGLFEEFLFRGFVQYTLARGVVGIVNAISPDNPRARTIGFWVAAFVFSVLLFAVAHISNGGETALGIITVSLAGLTFVYSLYRTGSLWWAVGFHTAWDWAQSFLYGVADSGQISTGHLLATHPAGGTLMSGGTTGPEGSILVVPTLLLTLAVIYKTLPKRATAFDA
jgi:membrane protease YdiL (CAAX protease family)